MWSLAFSSSPATTCSRVGMRAQPSPLMEHGKQRHQHLCAMRPGLRVLFMSGYTDDVIAKHGLVDPSIALLEKPLTHAALLRAVRSVIDAHSQLPAG
jgi:two-component system cell cycle sensor histidine kinase/response regulator CckA